MTRKTYISQEGEPPEPAVAPAIRGIVDQAQAPPYFAARVRAQVAQRQRRPALFRLWVPVLATGLLLSLALNVWWGAIVWRVVPPSPSHAKPPPSKTLVTGPPASGHAEAVADLLRPLAESYLKAGNYAKLRDVADLVLMLNPDVPQAYRYRGMAQAELGDEKQADQDLRRAAYLGDLEAISAWMAHQFQRFQ